MERNRNRVFLKIIILFMVLGSAFGGWLAYNNHKNKTSLAGSSTTAAPSDWSKYTDAKYGVEFIFPKAWGRVQVTEYSQQTGKHYEFSFAPDNKMYSITGAFDSASMTGAFTKADITSALAQDKKNFVKYDSSSYATISTERNVGIDKNLNLYELNFYQIIDLPKANASAVIIAFSITSKDSCPDTKLADNPSEKCINQSVFADINKFAKSIKSN